MIYTIYDLEHSKDLSEVNILNRDEVKDFKTWFFVSESHIIKSIRLIAVNCRKLLYHVSISPGVVRYALVISNDGIIAVFIKNIHDKDKSDRYLKLTFTLSSAQNIKNINIRSSALEDPINVRSVLDFEKVFVNNHQTRDMIYKITKSLRKIELKIPDKNTLVQDALKLIEEVERSEYRLNDKFINELEYRDYPYQVRREELDSLTIKHPPGIWNWYKQ